VRLLGGVLERHRVAEGSQCLFEALITAEREVLDVIVTDAAELAMGVENMEGSIAEATESAGRHASIVASSSEWFPVSGYQGSAMSDQWSASLVSSRAAARDLGGGLRK
jgi:hypothetical protein